MLYHPTCGWHTLDERCHGLCGLLAHGIWQHQALFLMMPTIGCYASVTVKNDGIQDIPCPRGRLRVLLQRDKIIGEQGFRTHRGQMRRNGLAPLLQLMHNRSPLPTFHDEQQTQGQTEHETAEGQEQFVPQAKRLERKKARQASTTALDWWRR